MYSVYFVVSEHSLSDRIRSVIDFPRFDLQYFGTEYHSALALRLAICELALPEGTPLVLDDALVCFDDVRLQTALAVLRQEAATRQILLFTCQSREAAALQAEALPHA